MNRNSGWAKGKIQLSVEEDMGEKMTLKILLICVPPLGVLLQGVETLQQVKNRWENGNEEN